MTYLTCVDFKGVVTYAATNEVAYSSAKAIVRKFVRKFEPYTAANQAEDEDDQQTIHDSALSRIGLSQTLTYKASRSSQRLSLQSTPIDTKRSGSGKYAVTPPV